MQLLLGGIVYSFGNQSFAAYFICRIILCMRQILYSIKAVGIPADFLFPTKRKSEERGGNEGYPFGEKHDGYKLGSAFA